MKLVVDTNILIDFSRKKRAQKEEIIWPKLVGFAKKEGHQLILPAINIFELFVGDEMNILINQEKAENLLNDVLILDLNKEIARKAADLFRKYKTNIGVVDYLLAATAIILEEGEFATLNPKHFILFKELHLFDFRRLGN